MNARELLNATVIYCLVAAVVVPGGSLVRAMRKEGTFLRVLVVCTNAELLEQMCKFTLSLSLSFSF